MMNYFSNWVDANAKPFMQLIKYQHIMSYTFCSMHGYGSLLSGIDIFLAKDVLQ